jgi:hypothetical protein
MAHGCHCQFDLAFDLFLFRLLNVYLYCCKNPFYDGDIESTRGQDPTGR